MDFDDVLSDEDEEMEDEGAAAQASSMMANHNIASSFNASNVYLVA